MEPLTPNTTAILEYIAANYGPNAEGANDFLNGNPANNVPFDLPFSSSANMKAINVSGNGTMPNSLPPSAFNMPVPGRDTPEATPESSNGADNSPIEGKNGKGIAPGMDAGSDSDALVDVNEANARRKSAAGQGSGAQNKRKAGHAHKVEQISDDEDDSESDDPAGHEDKRPHPNDRLSPLAGSGKKGGRKSKGGDEDGTPKLNKESKAARRKEQNRAAQKAFRERREAKVKDLEDHIAELEAKSKGQSTENENLRNLLRTLQDENVRLKQSAFTFQMPMSGTSTPQTNAVNGNNGGSGAKAPSPPEQEVLRSVHDLTPPLSRSNTNPPPIAATNNAGGGVGVPQGQALPQQAAFLKHRSSTSSSAGAPADSPQSMTSGTTASTSSIPSAQAHPSFDSADMFNAFASGMRPEWLKAPLGPQGAATQGAHLGHQQQPSRQTSTSGSIPSLSPPTVEGTNNADLQALWASFFTQSANATGNNGAANASAFPQQQSAQNIPNANGGQSQSQFANLGNADMSPFNLFATNGNANTNGPNAQQNADNMAFRDSSFANTGMDNQSANQNQQTQNQAPLKTGWTPGVQQPQVFDWTNNSYSDDTGINEFLASLTGNSGGNYNNSFEPNDISAEDEFTAQLQKLLDQSGSGAAAALNSPDQLFGMPNVNGGMVGDMGNNWTNFGMGNGMGMGANAGMMGTNDSSPANSNGNGSNNGWSPSNYLNMSPFASSGSASASDSPSSNLRESSASLSNSASPEPISGMGMGMGMGMGVGMGGGAQGGHMNMLNGNGVNASLSPAGSGNGGSANKALSPNHTVVQVPSADPAGSKRAVQDVFAAAKRGDVVHVVGEDGKILKPSDVWVRMGMHQSNQVDNLLIDDLCDQMKQKATCQDGSYRLSVKDAERMFKYKGQQEDVASAACPFNKSA